MKNSLKSIYKHQKGAAVLLISVVILIAVTILIIYAARVGLLDQKISGNEYRHKEAFANAEAGLAQASAYLAANSILYDGNAADGWRDCTTPTDITGVFPCDINGAVMVLDNNTTGDTIDSAVETISNINAKAYLVKTATNIIAVGQGWTEDQTGSAQVQVAFVKTTLITPGEIPPVMAPELNLNGGFTIVADPNNGPGATGIPISGWSATNTSGTGTWQTCQLGEYKDGGRVCSDIYTSGDDWSGCSCAEDLSNKDKLNYDIYTQASDFPDPFEYVFGKPIADINDIRDKFATSGHVYTGDCTGLATLDLTTLDKPWVWVDGDCDVPDVGTLALPVVLVVAGTMKLNASTDAWGLLFSITKVQSNGAAVVHGSLVAEADADIANGGYTQVYDERVLTALADDENNAERAKVSYSWHDFAP